MKSLATKLLIVVLVASCGGFLGYLSQSGIADVFDVTTSKPGARDRALNAALQPTTEEDYRRKIEQGWWYGCYAGAILGLMMVAGFGKPALK